MNCVGTFRETPLQQGSTFSNHPQIQQRLIVKWSAVVPECGVEKINRDRTSALIYIEHLQPVSQRFYQPK